MGPTRSQMRTGHMNLRCCIAHSSRDKLQILHGIYNSEKNKAEEDKKTTFYLLIILMFLNKIWSNSKNI